MNYNEWEKLKRRLTKQTVVHYNGGDQWSAIQYALLLDDEPIPGMRWYVRTNGRPNYHITESTISVGTQKFNILEGATVKEAVEFAVEQGAIKT